MGNASRVHHAGAVAALAVAIGFGAPSASAAEEESRQVDLIISSQQPLPDLQRCVTRKMASAGRVTPVPIDGGVALDFQTPGLFGPGRSRMAFNLVDRQTHREMTATYRHPLSEKMVAKLLSDAAKHCAYPPPAS